MAKKAKSAAKANQTAPYKHPEAKSLMRPEVGTQAQFKKKKAPRTYRYDSSLWPALDWDAKNSARGQGETLIKQVLDAKSLEEAKAAASKLKSLSKPFLNWAGKAERLSFDVPTLPLFIHERLSTKAIIETLAGHKTDKQEDMFALFGDPQHSITDQVLKAYEYQDNWTNRMVLGDSLVVMNSLLHYEGLGGQVQMIYMDPPYGVKFGSNFQPFVRKRDVSHNDDEDMTREPEMVQAYRDTWELGLHSYLTYLRDRLLLARDLLTPSGSIFVQISDENLHHVREVMDEVFGGENVVGQITFLKTSTTSSEELNAVSDYILWYAKDRNQVKLRTLYLQKAPGQEGASQYTWAEHANGDRVNYGAAEKLLNAPPGSRVFTHSTLTSQRPAGGTDLREFEFKGKTFRPGKGTFKTDLKGMKAIAAANRFLVLGESLRFVRYLNDFPAVALGNVWGDTVTSGFAEKKVYVVQTQPLVIQRCLLMTTDPGDLVLDPTCGSGRTAYVSEQWGRRWITADTSRVPLALVNWEGDGVEDAGAGSAEAYGSFVDRMLEVLRKSPLLRLEGNKTVTLKNIRPPAKTLSLSAEALVANGQDKPVALVFGPENGAVSEKLVYEAAREAHAKSFTHLYVVGFAIQPNARTLVEKCSDVMGVPATYVQATPDLMMGDLMKNMRSSQIFSVCGQPEIKVTKNKDKQYQVELLGLDVFDPITMEVTHRSGNDVPAWFLDTDYNDLCFHVSQAFFPRTSAWDNLKKALKGEYEESVWDHLSGTTSAPFEVGEHKQIAVKVIDDRGNELLVVKNLN